MSTVILPTEPTNLNEDPLSHEHGAHPIATGVGAMGGGATGAAIGATVGGPIGGVIGAIIGAVAGGLGGTAVGEQVSPTVEPLPGSGEAGEGTVAWPTHEAIAYRAWLYFEHEGRPDGHDLRHWLAAEQDLRAGAVN
jgi:hypothetical protein